MTVKKLVELISYRGKLKICSKVSLKDHFRVAPSVALLERFHCNPARNSVEGHSYTL